MTDEAFLTVLAVDDEPPALDELAYLLNADPRVFAVYSAGDATEALRVLRDTDVDAVFLDIRMPGLDGMALAVVEADRLDACMALERPGEAGRGVLAAGEQHQGAAVGDGLLEGGHGRER